MSEVQERFGTDRKKLQIFSLSKIILKLSNYLSKIEAAAFVKAEG
jgi:hypothetical protein